MGPGGPRCPRSCRCPPRCLRWGSRGPAAPASRRPCGSRGGPGTRCGTPRPRAAGRWAPPRRPLSQSTVGSGSRSCDKEGVVLWLGCAGSICCGLACILRDLLNTRTSPVQWGVAPLSDDLRPPHLPSTPARRLCKNFRAAFQRCRRQLDHADESNYNHHAAMPSSPGCSSKPLRAAGSQIRTSMRFMFRICVSVNVMYAKYRAVYLVSCGFRTPKRARSMINVATAGDGGTAVRY